MTAPEDTPHPSRLDVAVTPESVEALRAIIDREGVSLTEAVRRLIGYGEFVYRHAREGTLHVGSDNEWRVAQLTRPFSCSGSTGGPG